MLQLQTWLTALGLLALLPLAQRLVRRFRLPDLPVQLMGMSVVAWLLVTALPNQLLDGSHMRWLRPIDELLFSFVGIRMLLWALVGAAGGLRLAQTPAGPAHPAADAGARHGGHRGGGEGTGPV